MTITFGKKQKPVVEATVEPEVKDIDLFDLIDKYWPYISLGLVVVTIYNFGKVVAVSQIMKGRAIGR